MRRFRFVCIDKVTGGEMIFSECSYNMACYSLESQLRQNGDEITGTHSPNLEQTEIYTKSGLTFLYDEPRGILVKM